MHVVKPLLHLYSDGVVRFGGSYSSPCSLWGLRKLSRSTTRNLVSSNSLTLPTDCNLTSNSLTLPTHYFSLTLPTHSFGKDVSMSHHACHACEGLVAGWGRETRTMATLRVLPMVHWVRLLRVNNCTDSDLFQRWGLKWSPCGLFWSCTGCLAYILSK